MIGRGRNLSEERSRLRVDVRSAVPERLDSYLVSSLPWRSRNRVQRLIREGRVTVNGEPGKASRRVRAGDVLELHLSSGSGIPGDYAERELELLYEDAWLLAVNKPPGLLVHPVGRHVYDTLINYLHHRYHGSGADGREVIPRLCHRLDRETTGVLVVAKDAYVHREVMYQFENRLVEKRYLTLVEGRFPSDLGRIDIPIGSGRSLEAALQCDVLKPSRTEVEVLHHFEDCTLLRCIPSTGRQNQIRVHVAAAGHPVAGDVRYGGRGPEEDSDRRGWPRRYLLHSELLRFYHPRLKGPVELRARLPEDFRRVLGPIAGTWSPS